MNFEDVGLKGLEAWETGEGELVSGLGGRCGRVIDDVENFWTRGIEK